MRAKWHHIPVDTQMLGCSRDPFHLEGRFVSYEFHSHSHPWDCRVYFGGPSPAHEFRGFREGFFFSGGPGHKNEQIIVISLASWVGDTPKVNLPRPSKGVKFQAPRSVFGGYIRGYNFRPKRRIHVPTFGCFEW